ncbi:MAG: hypothetical protein WCE62_03820 [Polyangiales bacterium]
MSYAEFYDSFVQHPLLLWIAALVGLLVALSRRGLARSVRWYCVVLAIVSALDAWLTSARVAGLGPLPGAAATFVPLAFVLIGDFRYFLFVESAQPNGSLAIRVGPWARACVWTFVVPIASQVLTMTFGSDDPRFLFLIYETLFVVLSIGIIGFYLPGRSDALRWTRLVTGFVMGTYALWALADATILTVEADMGFLIRVLPNVLYYGGLGPVLAWTAPVRSSLQGGA